MAVHCVPDGVVDEDDIEDENGVENSLFVDEGLVDDQSDPFPSHIVDIVTAVLERDVSSLCRALDSYDGCIDVPVEDGDTLLHLACLYGYADCVRLLLDRGACLESKDEDGAIPLHDACAGGYTDIAKLLLNASNDECVRRMLETVDTEGDTPLHHAARGQHVNVIKLLLTSGASPTKPNSSGKTPSELADLESEARQILHAAACSMTCC